MIFGHAKDGNLHFMLTERFDGPDAVQRYARITEEIVELVLDLGGGATQITQAAATELGLPGSNVPHSDTIQSGGMGDMGGSGSLNIQSSVYNVNGGQNPNLIRPRVKVSRPSATPTCTALRGVLSSM